MSTRIASRTLVEKLPISRPSQYICRACRQNINTASHLSQQRRYASDGPKEETFIEKTRKKLWQGQPPGPENIDDVYGGPGFFATVAKERRSKRERKFDSPPEATTQRPTKPKESEITEEESVFKQPAATQAEFIERLDDFPPRAARHSGRGSHATRAQELRVDEADVPLAQEVTTWKGLEAIGHQGEWQMMPPAEIDEYEPWQKMDSNLKWTQNELIALMSMAAEQKEFPEMPLSPGDVRLPQLSEAEKSAFLAQHLSFEQGHNATEAHLSTLHLLSRFSKLVRRRIPDPVLTKISRRTATPTVKDFLDLFAEKSKPKPKSVAEVLLNNEKLSGHSNLLVFGRRETPVDKEKEVGRWKVIEEQLIERGLPVLGRHRVVKH